MCSAALLCRPVPSDSLPPTPQPANQLPTCSDRRRALCARRPCRGDIVGGQGLRGQAQKNQPQLYQDVELLFSEPTEPDMDATNKGHGRLERRKVWVSEQLCSYSEFPGLASVIKIAKWVEYLKDGRVVQSVQYAVSSLCELSPSRALSLVRGHWSIENSLFHVKDDSFGEDRHVMHQHSSGEILSLLRNVAVSLLRGVCSLWCCQEPLSGRSQRLCAQPSVALNQY